MQAVAHTVSAQTETNKRIRKKGTVAINGRRMTMYKSPITIVESTIDNFTNAIIEKRDDAIFAEIQHSFGVDVDRVELIKALRYDRNQYEAGYLYGKKDALDSITHCKNCTHSDTISCSDGMVWCGRMCRYMKEDGFCSFGDAK